MLKKLLTIDDLIKFCAENNFQHFSSAETGYKLCVQVPATFEVSDDNSRRGLMKLKIRVYHLGINRNGSHVSKESSDAAIPSIADRPVLAYIHQLDDGEWDFESHNINVIENEDGTIEYEYLESQIGSFTSEEPFYEYDEEMDKTYLCAYAVIPEEYSKAADIIRRKNGTKNSCELAVDEFTFNAKEKYLDLKSFCVYGTTLLGSRSDGTEVGEGMLGSRADIAEFSEQVNRTNSKNLDEKLIETLERLNETLSNFNINENSKEGGNLVTKFDELLKKYGKTAEEITFEYDGLSDEELEAKFAEVFEDGTEGDGDENPESTSEGEGEVVVENEGDENPEDPAQDPDPAPIVENEAVKPSKYSVSMSNGMVKEFELSLDDIQCALYSLVNDTYGEVDNTWYGVSTYERHVIMHDYWNNRHYKQTYKRDEDDFSLTGDRVEVYANWLTKDEETSLAEMRSNYSVMETELNQYKVAEENAKKDALFELKDYASIAMDKEFTSLKSNHTEFSVDSLKEKLDQILLSYAKSGKLNFSENKPRETSKTKLPINTPKKSRYGSLKFN